MTQYDPNERRMMNPFLNALGSGITGLGGRPGMTGNWGDPKQPQLPPRGWHPQQPPIQQQLDPWGIKGMGEQITGFEEQLGGYGETLGGYGEQIGGFGEQLGGLGERMGGFESTLGGLGEKMGGFGDQFSNISDRLGKIEEGIAGLNKQSPIQQAQPPGHTSSYGFNPYSMLGGLGGLFGYPGGFGRY